MRSQPDKILGIKISVTAWLVYTAFGAPYIIREQFPAMSLSESGTLNVIGYFG